MAIVVESRIESVASRLLSSERISFARDFAVFVSTSVESLLERKSETLSSVPTHADQNHLVCSRYCGAQVMPVGPIRRRVMSAKVRLLNSERTSRIDYSYTDDSATAIELALLLVLSEGWIISRGG